MQETLFQVAKPQGPVLFREKSPRQGCTTQKSGLGMHQPIVLTRIQISKYPNIQISRFWVDSNRIWLILIENQSNPIGIDPKSEKVQIFNSRGVVHGQGHGQSNCIVCRLLFSDGWRDIFCRLFRTRSAMGRLWDDHFRKLGYPPKFYKGQDAGFDSGSSIW